jgi:hypothetical protein
LLILYRARTSNPFKVHGFLFIKFYDIGATQLHNNLPICLVVSH